MRLPRGRQPGEDRAVFQPSHLAETCAICDTCILIKTGPAKPTRQMRRPRKEGGGNFPGGIWHFASRYVQPNLNRLFPGQLRQDQLGLVKENARQEESSHYRFRDNYKQNPLCDRLDGQQDAQAVKFQGLTGVEVHFNIEQVIISWRHSSNWKHSRADSQEKKEAKSRKSPR